MVEAHVHRKLAVDLFNYAWELIRTPERTKELEDEMLHAAHASRFHWGKVGDANNLAIGEWQISRVYAILGRAEPALAHGTRSLELCEQNDLSPFMYGYSHEAIARAHRITPDQTQFNSHLDSAFRYLAQLTDPEERELLSADLDELESSR